MHGSTQIMYGLYSLTHSKSKITVASKRDVYWWKETAFNFILVLQGKGIETQFE